GVDSATANLEIEGRLERLRADIGERIVESAEQQLPGGGLFVFRQLRSDFADEHLKPAPADILEPRGQSQLGTAQRPRGVERVQSAESRIPDTRFIVKEQRAETLDGAGIFEDGQCLTDLDPSRGIVLTAELQQQTEGARIVQHSEPASAAQTGIKR